MNPQSTSQAQQADPVNGSGSHDATVCAPTAALAPAGHDAPPPRFDYATAFSRNIGWVTEAEQQALRTRCIAIAGTGGVGGHHLLTLARMGIGRFRVAEFDTFELANFNRQAGATMSTVGHRKLDVMARTARDINPTLTIDRFPAGVHAENVDDFLEGADLFIDGVDFFAVKARRALFDACARKGIPAITAAPLGMGAAWLCFLPGKMTFEQYFRLEGHDEPEQLLRFLVGLAPAGLHRRYLVDPSRVDLAAHRGPSTPMAAALCAGVAGTQAVKVLLGRGKVTAAPWCLQFDPHREKFVRSWRPGGNRHPLQQLALLIGRRSLARAHPPQ